MGISQFFPQQALFVHPHTSCAVCLPNSTNMTKVQLTRSDVSSQQQKTAASPWHQHQHGGRLHALHWLSLTLHTLRHRTRPLSHNQGTILQCESMFINGRMIRYVHIPDTVNVAHTLTKYGDMLRRARGIYTRSKRRKDTSTRSTALAAPATILHN